MGQEEAGAAIGMSKSGYVKLERGERKLTIEHLPRIAKAFGVSLGDVIEEPGEPRRMSEAEEWDEHSADFERVEVDGVYDPDGYKPSIRGGTPELDIGAGAGEGTVGEVLVLSKGSESYSGHRVQAEWLFPPNWIEGELHANRAQTFVVPIRGDSMEPTYRPGDRVLVDRSQNMLTEDTVYLISDGESHPRVKRLVEVMFSKPRQVQIVSDNPAIENQTVALAELTIIGRVVGVASRR